MIMHTALLSRDDADKLYVPRKEEGSRLASIEDSVDASIQRLEDDIQNRGGSLITTTRNNTNYTRITWTTISRKQNKGNKNIWTF